MQILIAEDDPMVQELLATFLRDLGHEVRAVDNGDRLVKLALESAPDLIITDMHMPEMRGDSMIAMLDMYAPLTGVPVIMVTGATERDIREAGIPKEIPVLGKPLDFDQLSAEIEKVEKDRRG